MATLLKSDGAPWLLSTGAPLLTTMAAINDQTIYFGGLTTASAGGAEAIRTDGVTYEPITSVDSVISGDGSGWTVSGGKLVRTTATPASSDGAVLECSTALGTINVTIASSGNDPFGRDLAVSYSVATYAELESLMDPSTGIGDAGLSGKVVLLRPAEYSWTNDHWDTRNYTSVFTIGAHRMDWAAQVNCIEQGSFDAPKNITIDGLDFYYECTPGVTSVDSTPITIGVSTTIDNLTVRRCRHRTNASTLGFVRFARGFWKMDSGTGGTAVTLAAGGCLFEDNLFDGCYRSWQFPRNPLGASCIFRRNEVINFDVDVATIRSTQSLLCEDTVCHSPWNAVAEAGFVAGGHKTGIYKTGGWTGKANSKQATFFALFNNDYDVASERIIYAEGTQVNGEYFKIALDATDHIIVEAFQAGDDPAVDTPVVSLTSTSTYKSGTSFYLGVLVTLDTDGTHRLDIWNNATKTWALEASQAGGSETLDLTTGIPSINNDPIVADLYENACFYRRVAFWPGVHVDGSSSSIRDTLIDANEPSYRPSDNSLAVTAIGTPILDMQGHADFVTATNQGSGGDGTRVGLVEYPHTDFFQNSGESANVTFRRCIFIDARSDGIEYRGNRQVIFLEDVTPGNHNDLIIEDCIAFTYTGHGMSVYNGIDCWVRGCTLIANPDKAVDADLASVHPRSRFLLNAPAGSPESGNRVTDNISPVGGNGIVLSQNNTTPDTSTVAAYRTALTAAFDWDWTASTPLSVADILAAVTPKTGGTIIDLVPVPGAVGDYNDFVNYTSDHPRLETGFTPSMTDNASATAGASVSHAAVTLSGLSSTGALIWVDSTYSVEIQILNADDTVKRAWSTDRAIAFNGEKFEIRVNAPAKKLTALNNTVWVGNNSDVWTVTSDTTDANDDPLDTVSNTDLAAWSLSRYLRSAMTGAVIKLREDNTNTEADFELNSNQVLVRTSDGTTTVAAWKTATGATNLYASYVWDHSANGFDLQQTTLADQPLFVDAGSELGLLPCLDFSAGTNIRLTSVITQGGSATVGLDAMVTCRRTSVGVNAGVIGTGASSTINMGIDINDYWSFTLDSTGADVFSSTTTAAQDTTYVAEWHRDAGADPQPISITVNGSSVLSDNSTTTDWRDQAIVLGNNSTGGVRNFTGLIAEAMYKKAPWSSGDLTTARTSLSDWVGL